jgi:hypothetical protein
MSTFNFVTYAGIKKKKKKLIKKKCAHAIFASLMCRSMLVVTKGKLGWRRTNAMGNAVGPLYGEIGKSFSPQTDSELKTMTTKNRLQ